MQTAEDVQRINRTLGRMGLGQLGEPGVLAQLGFLVQDHDHLRELLNKCEPRLRRDMYESLRPHLQFTAHPLDWYEAENARQADVRQLPTFNEDGSLKPYQTPEIRTVEAALLEGVAKGHLELVCRKCTKAEVFAGVTKGDAIFAARKAGWTYGLDHEGKGREICPDCE